MVETFKICALYFVKYIVSQSAVFTLCSTSVLVSLPISKVFIAITSPFPKHYFSLTIIFNILCFCFHSFQYFSNLFLWFFSLTYWLCKSHWLFNRHSFPLNFVINFSLYLIMVDFLVTCLISEGYNLKEKKFILVPN